MSTPVVTIGTPEITFADGITTVSADLNRTGADPHRIWYALPVDRVTPEQASDAFFLIGHRVAMVHGTSLTMNTPVSAQLIHGARSLEDVYGLWFPDEDFVVDSHVKPRNDDPTFAENRGLATCFTGGIDSTYSLLNPPRDLSQAVFVHGFDIPLDRTEFHAKVMTRLSTLTEGFGITLMQVTSNVRDLIGDRLTWGYHLHGPALASVGILLADLIDELLLPSSETSRHIDTHNGSHQITDRLTSTSYLHVTHHGTKVSRIDKTANIAQNKAALQTLRPCFRSWHSYNCGQCPKCIRTSLEMEIIGCRKAVKRNFRVWRTRAELLAGIAVTNPTEYRSARGAIAYIEKHGGNRAFLTALQAAAADFELRRSKDSLVQALSHLTPEHTDHETLSVLRGSFDDVRARWRRRRARAIARRVKTRITALAFWRS